MLKRMIIVVAMMLSCNLYASQQYDRHSGKKAFVASFVTFVSSGVAHKGLECGLPEHRFLTGATSTVAVISAVYAVSNMRKYYNLSRVEE